MFKIKLPKFLIIAVSINLLLFLIIYSLPFNILQALIGYSTSLFVFIFGLGIKVEVVKQTAGFYLVTQNGRMLLYQTFYEFLTIFALTIPLYWRKWKMLIKKLAVILTIMSGYYTVLYGLTIILLDNGHKATLLLKFIDFNTESFMIFAFSIIWFLVNSKEIKQFFKNSSQ